MPRQEPQALRDSLLPRNSPFLHARCSGYLVVYLIGDEASERPRA